MAAAVGLARMPVPGRVVVWTPLWDPQREGQGLEHLLLREGVADSIILGFDAAGQPYRLSYTLTWDTGWRPRTLRLVATTVQEVRVLQLAADGAGTWHNGDGEQLPTAQGCLDLDLWPTPFTNTLAIRRLGLGLHERQELRVVYLAAPALTVTVERQAYTRLAERLYMYENVDSGYRAALPVDGEGVVLDYPGLFRRLY